VKGMAWIIGAGVRRVLGSEEVGGEFVEGFRC